MPLLSHTHTVRFTPKSRLNHVPQKSHFPSQKLHCELNYFFFSNFSMGFSRVWNVFIAFREQCYNIVIRLLTFFCIFETVSSITFSLKPVLKGSIKVVACASCAQLAQQQSIIGLFALLCLSIFQNLAAGLKDFFFGLSLFKSEE